MNLEELAFVNQQLAGMLKSGIPLEGSLRQLSANMRGGRLREELSALEADLARGLPLEQALVRRQLPDFYVKMLQLGAQSNDLPGVLTLVADHYERAHLVWTRLKGLMVYPVIVLTVSLGLSAFAALVCTRLITEATALTSEAVWSGSTGADEVTRMLVGMWAPVVTLLIILLAVAAALGIPTFRRTLRWWLPGFRENSLANLGATLSLMLRGGGHLAEALDLTEKLEAGTPVRAELRHWKTRLADGHGTFANMVERSKVIPPLFLWLVAQAGEDLAKGFQRAAEIYRARALYRIELLLYAALPVSVLMLGIFIISQFFPLMRALSFHVQTLGEVGG